MGLDLERVKSKLEALKNANKRGGPREKRTWKPSKDKTSTIRLVTYPFGPDPFMELWFHYGIGGEKEAGILCPKLNSGRSCPICELAQTLKESGNKADMDSARSLYAKQRVYAVVIDRADPTMTPKYWGFGKQVYETLLSYLMSEDYGSYMDPVNGLDLEIKYENKAGKAWPDTVLTFKRKESRLAENDKKTQEILNNVVAIDEVFKPITVAEIKEKLNKWLSGNSEEDTSSESGSKEVVKGGGTTNNSKLGNEHVEDLEGAFDEALASSGLED